MRMKYWETPDHVSSVPAASTTSKCRYKFMCPDKIWIFLLSLSYWLETNLPKESMLQHVDTLENLLLCKHYRVKQDSYRATSRTFAFHLWHHVAFISYSPGFHRWPTEVCFLIFHKETHFTCFFNQMSCKQMYFDSKTEKMLNLDHWKKHFKSLCCISNFHCLLLIFSPLWSFSVLLICREQLSILAEHTTICLIKSFKPSDANSPTICPHGANAHTTRALYTCWGLAPIWMRKHAL